MSYDWEIISTQPETLEAYYRLLGEMLHRRATPDDLQQVRAFLSTTRLGEDIWLSLGEALYQTTAGSSEGYRIWCAWSRNTMGERFDEADQLMAWRRFQTDSSDGLEHNTDASEEAPPLLGADADETQRTEDPFENVHYIAQDPLQAISLIPVGPYTIRLFDSVYENVDEFALLRLLQSGVFLQIDVLFGMRWMSVTEHPGFESLIRRLRQEAVAHLATTEQSRAEITQPGTC